MPEGLGYPVDYAVTEIRSRIPTTIGILQPLSAIAGIADEVQDLYDEQLAAVEASAWAAYQADGEEVEGGHPVERELFRQAVDRTFDAILYAQEKTRDITASVGLAPIDELPNDEQIVTWRPKEHLRGYMYRTQIVVDVSDPESDDPPLTFNMFYGLRSDELLTFGTILRRCLDDFEAQTGPEGGYPGQPILGAVVSGVYYFERD